MIHIECDGMFHRFVVTRQACTIEYAIKIKDFHISWLITFS